jgi:hypothetical protein
MYCDAVICDALDYKIITYDDIAYQLKPSKILNPHFFEAFVLSIVKNFDGYKAANNGFIGMLGRSHTARDKHYFTQDRTNALKEWLNNPDEVSYNGIYNNEKDIHNYKFMDTSNLQAMIDTARNRSKHFDPIVWMINITKKHHYILVLYQSNEKL